MCQDVSSSVSQYDCQRQALIVQCKEKDCVHVRVCVSKHACVPACVALPLAALSVSRLCRGLSKQNCSQKLLPGLTEQEVDCYVSQGEPLRPRCSCLPLVWLWTHRLVQAISGKQKMLCSSSGINIHSSIKPTKQKEGESSLGSHWIFCFLWELLWAHINWSKWMNIFGRHFTVCSGDLLTFNSYWTCKK